MDMNLCLYGYGPYMFLGEKHQYKEGPVIPTLLYLTHIKCPHIPVHTLPSG